MTEPAPLEVVLRLPARGGLELVASQTAASLAEHAGASESVASEIRMALIEGCINAIEHAYAGGADDGWVEITMRVSRNSDRMTISIADSGGGFEFGDYKEPTLEQKLHAPVKRGWGIKLIRGLMDELHVHTGQEGTTIEMTKFLSS